MTRNAPAWIGLTILAATAAYLSATQLAGLQTAASPDNLARLASGVALLVVIGGSAWFGHRGPVSVLMKQALAWVAIGLALVVVYTYRSDFERLGARVFSHLVPGVAVQAEAHGDGSGTVAVTAGLTGQFEVEALVNGTNVRFIADTGATLVALSNEDARRAGIDTASLSYSIPVQTANGVVRNALVHLAEIEVGTIRLESVRALVAKPGQLETSLLGMSFLSRLRSFQISGDQLILQD